MGSLSAFQNVSTWDQHEASMEQYFVANDVTIEAKKKAIHQWRNEACKIVVGHVGPIKARY